MKKIVISMIALVCLWVSIWGVAEIVFSDTYNVDAEETYYEYTDDELACWYMDHVGMSDKPIYIEIDESYNREGYIKVDYYYVSSDYTETWYGGYYIVDRDYCIDNMF